MAGPLPKPSAARRRRNAPTYATVLLPAAGRTEAPPACPLLTEAGQEWWEVVWRSPSATQWQLMDVPALARLGRLLELVAAKPDPRYMPEIRQLEDRFGLTPKARASLRWEVGEDSVADTVPLSAARRRSLRVVDSDGAFATDPRDYLRDESDRRHPSHRVKAVDSASDD